MKHGHKQAVTLSADLAATDSADTFIVRAGETKTVSGFDASADRVMFDVNHSYSDILFLGSVYDGFTFDTFSGAHLEVHAGDYNGDGITDTQVSLSGVDGIAVATLYSVLPESLHGWNLMGG